MIADGRPQTAVKMSQVSNFGGQWSVVGGRRSLKATARVNLKNVS